jgi:hypothetical protein
MKIEPIRGIENNVFTTTLAPTEFGTSTVTSEAEIAMLVDFPQTLRYADINFVDNFKVVNGLPAISAESDAVEVKIDNLTNKEFQINENLSITLSIDANKIPASEVDGVVFTTALQVAQAKIILFETKVLAKIKELMDNARANVNDFEITTEVIL